MHACTLYNYQVAEKSKWFEKCDFFFSLSISETRAIDWDGLDSVIILY